MVEKKCFEARQAALKMPFIDAEQKNRALLEIAKGLDENREAIKAANRLDMEEAARSNLELPLLKRLDFKDAKIDDVIQGLKDLAAMKDPVGVTGHHCQLDDDLDLYRVSSPLGVIAVIFESRPDALVQISGLGLKSSNAVILKGGSEAANTNEILTDIIAQASYRQGMPQGWISLLHSRSDVQELLKQEKYVDLIIPRGSNEFVRMIMSSTHIPVLGHADGVCHTYLDSEADLAMAKKVMVDAKTQYTAVCNATETMLFHKDIAKKALPLVAEALRDKGVEIFGCERSVKLIGGELVKDWHTEYLDLQVSFKIVDSLEEAVDHINTYGSGHTDAIISSREDHAASFMDGVDSGNVYWNCSTRFSDGFRYGFGAEVGVSTSKIHARGPVGLEGLLTYKYKIIGKGQTVGEYSTGVLTFKHRGGKKDFPI